MTNRKYVRLREQGRRLASEREDLIAAGVDPAELAIPLHPFEPLPRRAGRHAMPADPYDDAPVLESDLARVWMIVAAACVAAFAGLVAAAVGMLMAYQVPTWHVWATFVVALVWGGGSIAATRTARRLYRQARSGGAR